VGRSPNFAKSQAPEREVKSRETEMDADAAFVAQQLKGKDQRQFDSSNQLTRLPTRVSRKKQ